MQYYTFLAHLISFTSVSLSGSNVKLQYKLSSIIHTHTCKHTTLLFWSLKFYTGSTVLLGHNSREGTLRDCLKFRRRVCPGESPRYLTCKTKMLTVWLVEDKKLRPSREERWSDRNLVPRVASIVTGQYGTYFFLFIKTTRRVAHNRTVSIKCTRMKLFQCFGWRQMFLLLLTRRES